MFLRTIGAIVLEEIPALYPRVSRALTGPVYCPYYVYGMSNKYSYG